ncbi:A24 family peptidase [Actibacterium sp. D379-3]
MIPTTNPALWFLICAAPICLWVAWSDMKTMLIPNKAVYTLVAVFAVVGLLVLPLDTYMWRWSHLAVVLVIGFAMNMVGMIGAGDAKFAAAMAPFVALADLGGFAILFSVVLLSAFLLHRVARRIPALRRAAPGWESWDRKDFPMGLALGSVLLLYLAMRMS